MQPDTDEKIEWSHLSGVPGVEVLLVNNSARRWVVFHSKYAICTCLRFASGTIEWKYRGGVHDGGAGTIMLFEPGEVHANTKVTPMGDFRALHIEPSFILTAAAEMGMRRLTPHWRSAFTLDPTLYRTLAGLHASLEAASSPLESQSRFFSSVRLLLERCSESTITSCARVARGPLLRARDLIRERYSERVTLDELAGASGVSRFHLVRAFAREFGVPPHAYQIQVQVTKARQLLSAGAPLAEVAAETGFADQSHFTRHFKRTYGVTPGRYRDAVLGG